MFKGPKKDDESSARPGGRMRDMPSDRFGNSSSNQAGKPPGSQAGNQSRGQAGDQQFDQQYDEQYDDAEEIPAARPYDRGGRGDRQGGRSSQRSVDKLKEKKPKSKGMWPARGAKDKKSEAKVSLSQRFKNWLAERRTQHVVEPEKIELGRRIMALGIDFGAAFMIAMVLQMLPLVNRFLDMNMSMLSLVCVRDYFYGGRGLGKNIMGLRVVDIFNGQSPTLKAAIMRNLVYIGPLFFFQALQRILGIIPMPGVTIIIGQVGNALATVYVLVILPLECYRAWQREDSMRLGDEVAGTCIIESETDFSEFLPKK